MLARRRGRPTAGDESVSTENILSEALHILDTGGLDRLTMRALAKRVGINPMTIYHHFENRDGLIRALANRVYSDVTTPTTGDALSRVVCLLKAYHAKVIQHPALTLAIFSRPVVFPSHAKRITAELTDLLSNLGLSPQRALLWVHILVDYVHGAALAVAVSEGHEQPGLSSDNNIDEFDRGIAELLVTFKTRLSFS